MSGWIVAMVVLLPFADVSGADGGAARIGECLTAVRRALAPEYPNDDGDEHFCARQQGRLFCAATCTDRNCHNDGCESWTAVIGVHLVSKRGRPVVRIDADVPAEEQRARRVLDRCLAQ